MSKLLVHDGEQYKCIYCGSKHLDGDWIDIETWSREQRCKDCGRTWMEEAQVVNLIIPAEYADAYKKHNPEYVEEHA